MRANLFAPRELRNPGSQLNLIVFSDKIPPLPTEIYQSIIGELVESPKTLCACALACHLFAQLAQKLLFSNISITHPKKVFQSSRERRSVWSKYMLRVLSSSPHLAGYVNGLKVTQKGQLQSYGRGHSSSHAVCQILLLLTNLKELDFGGGISEENWLDFREWGHELRAGILERCSSERLVTIRLTCVKNVPLSLLGLPPRLETLILEAVLFVPDSDRNTVGDTLDLQEFTKVTEKSSPAQLKHLSVIIDPEEWRTLYPWLISHLDLTHIKTLALHVDFDNTLHETVAGGLQAISRILRGCLATLDTLSLLMPDQQNTSNQPGHFELDVRLMPSLRELRLYSLIWNESQYLAVSGTHPTSSASQSPQTALRILSAIVSQALPPKTPGGEHDSSSHRQLETFTLSLSSKDMSSSGLENVGWDEFVSVIEALAKVGRLSLELERKAMLQDPRPLEEWETMLQGDVVRSFLPRPGATSVTVSIVLPGLSDHFEDGMVSLIREKLLPLQEKGVGLIIFESLSK